MAGTIHITPRMASPSPLSVASMQGLNSGNLLSPLPAIRVIAQGETGIDWQAARQHAAELVSTISLGLSGEDHSPLPPWEEGDFTSAAGALAALAVDIQRLVGIEVSRFREMAPNAEGLPTALFECQAGQPGMAVANAAVILLRASLSRGVQVAEMARAKTLIIRAMAHAKSRQSNLSIQAAERMGIPWAIAASTAYLTVALGQGRHRRLFWRHMTPNTSHIGVVVSTAKHLASEVLGRAGLPVPEQRLAKDLPAAIQAARSIGWPVVIKPSHTDFGTAVTTRIVDEETLAFSFAEAQKHGSVVVEKHIEGDNLRLLVYQGQCLSVVRQTPAQVTGDGRRSIAQLVEAVNRTRSDHLSANWKKIKLDDTALDVLRRQGLSVNDIPASGQIAFLRFHSNLSAGGTMENVTAATHPDIKRLAVSAASLIGIDLAGIDFVTPDHRQSYHDAGGAIVEVNVNPGFVMGEAENYIEDKVIGAHFPAPARGRIPIVGLMHAEDSSPPTHCIASLFAADNLPSAVATKDGVWVGAAKITTRSVGLAKRTALALSDHEAASAVLTMTPQDFSEGGLGVDRIHLAVLAPPWNRDPEPAFLALAALADNVVAPWSWLPTLLPSRCDPSAIWVIADAPTEEDPRINTVVWLAEEALIEIRHVKGPRRRLAPSLRPHMDQQDTALLIAAVAAALQSPESQMKETLDGYLQANRSSR